MLEEKVIIFKTEWMAYFDGPEDDVEFKRFKYPSKGNPAHEIYNFKVERDGWCYGYFPFAFHSDDTPKKLNFPDIYGKSAQDDKGNTFYSPLTVVWVATNSNDVLEVVGWYKNATVFVERQKYSNFNVSRHFPDEYEVFMARAKASDCRLLGPSARFAVSEISNNLGNTKHYYIEDKAEHSAFLEKLKQKIAYFEGEEEKDRRRWTPVDVEKRQKVERAAIDMAKLHYQSGDYDGFEVVSREKDNVGYDLEAIKGNKKLCIEVKGRSGPEVTADFSINEYKKIKAFQDGNFTSTGIYKICIVTQALEDKPQLYDFSCVNQNGTTFWFDKKNNQSICLEERNAARAIPLNNEKGQA
ncbi:MAG: DUF3883 domain-containing protein [Methylocystaceae bacterium]|nr:DUF3883 domain-containing protein [Methylocystaceae bacterium]